MSDDLTWIEAILQRPGTIGEQARAIASMIAEREAAARREALEEAAGIVETLHRGAEPFVDGAVVGELRQHIAAAIRSLAKEAADGQ